MPKVSKGQQRSLKTAKDCLSSSVDQPDQNLQKRPKMAIKGN